MTGDNGRDEFEHTLARRNALSVLDRLRVVEAEMSEMHRQLNVANAAISTLNQIVDQLVNDRAMRLVERMGHGPTVKPEG